MLTRKKYGFIALIFFPGKICNYIIKTTFNNFTPSFLYSLVCIPDNQHSTAARLNEGFINNAYHYDELDHSYLYGQFDADVNYTMPDPHQNPYEDSVAAEDADGGELCEDRDIRCLPEFQFSMLESEYDEALNIPDSVTIISSGGDKPVLVERKDCTDDDDYDEDDVELRRLTEIPFTRIYTPGIKFTSFQRKVFMPGTEIEVKIIDIERSVTTHLLNPNL